MYFQLEGARCNYEGQGLCSIDLPDIEGEREIPLVVAVHGSNRGTPDYDECPFYAEQKKIALRNGCAFAVISNKFDTWGTDDGLYNLKLLSEKLTSEYPVKKKVVLWATSAGGVLAHRFVKEYPQHVLLVIGTFPVYDLESTYPLKTCRVAWRSKSIEEFKVKTAGKNPALFGANKSETSFFVTHGSADTAVPLEANSLKLKKNFGDRVFLQIIKDGIHSTADFSFYGEAVDKAFERAKENGKA